MSLIENERTKLLANALDRASTVCLTVGVAVPVSGIVLGLNQLALTVIAACYGWLAVAVGLHLTARWVLGRLRI